MEKQLSTGSQRALGTATNTKIQATQQQLSNRNMLKSPVKAHSQKLTPIVQVVGQME